MAISGVQRCSWAGSDPELVAYHDHEWGGPQHADRVLFELSGEIVSGHSLKHLLAALALFVVYRMLRRRATR